MARGPVLEVFSITDSTSGRGHAVGSSSAPAFVVLEVGRQRQLLVEGGHARQGPLVCSVGTPPASLVVSITIVLKVTTTPPLGRLTVMLMVVVGC